MRFRRQFAFRRRMDHFADLLSSSGSGQESHGGPNGRTEGTTQNLTKNRAAGRTTSGSHSGADWMKIRFFGQFSCFFRHDETSWLITTQGGCQKAERRKDQ